MAPAQSVKFKKSELALFESSKSPLEFVGQPDVVGKPVGCTQNSMVYSEVRETAIGKSK